MASIGISNALDEDGGIGINFSCSFDGPGLCGFMTADSLRVGPPNREVAFLSLLNK